MTTRCDRYNTKRKNQIKKKHANAYNELIKYVCFLYMLYNDRAVNVLMKIFIRNILPMDEI